MGFLDRSSSTNEYTQNVSTITQTKVGDVGVTGSQAVELNRDVSNTLSSISKDNVAAYKLFSGSTENIVGKSLDANKDIITALLETGKSFISSAFTDVGKARTNNNEVASLALDQANQSAGNISSIMIKYGTFAVIIVGAFWAMNKKGKK